METTPSTLGVRVGFYAAVCTVVMTLAAFALAITAVPISGAFCPSNCIAYPYLDTVARYPGDFRWMIPAMLAVLGFVVLMGSLHVTTGHRERVLSLIALCFALIAATVLLADYYIQFSVVPASLMNSETDGLSLLIQYNPHGAFIALEELGYLVMSVSFGVAGAAMTSGDRLTSAVRWIFILAFILVLLSLLIISVVYGPERLDRFEVVAISITWLVLLVNGVLLALMFRRRLRSATQPAT